LPEPQRELAGWVEHVLKGDNAALARALDCVEDERSGALAPQRELLAALARATPEAHAVIGFTGPPGAGKSSLAGALLRQWLGRGMGVGITAVDPSSRRSGGALLGDRQRLGLQPGDRAFVRSMAARDRLGGLAPATRAAALVLRAAFERTLVETVGVGQSEVDVGSVADLVVLVLQPGAGDTLQFMKAGILEIPDLFVVHKWDLGDVAQRTRADLDGILALLPREMERQQPEVLGVSAQTGEGVAALTDALERALTRLAAQGALAQRRRESRAAWGLELFERRYGSYGVERLGGRSAARALASELASENQRTGVDLFTALEIRAELTPRAGTSGGR
jgi:LAO/AO transport system kinase